MCRTIGGRRLKNGIELIVNKNAKSPVTEAFRTLRTNIQFSNVDKDIKTIVITSSGPSEGKSLVSSNLAVTMGQVDKKILLIDADLRKPKVHEVFSLSNEDGLTTVLVEGLDYKEVVISTGIGSLDILTSGPIPPNPAEILGSNKMKSFLENIKEDYDIILIDSPPVGMVTDAAVLSTICDGVIIVSAAGQAIINAAINAKELLEKVNANIIGVVMNKVPLKKGGYYKYHYYSYYQSYYGDEDKGSRRSRKRKQAAGSSS